MAVAWKECSSESVEYGNDKFARAALLNEPRIAGEEEVDETAASPEKAWMEKRLPSLQSPCFDGGDAPSPSIPDCRRRHSIAGGFVPWRLEERAGSAPGSPAKRNRQYVSGSESTVAETISSEYGSEQDHEWVPLEEDDDCDTFPSKLDELDSGAVTPELQWPDTDDESDNTPWPSMREPPRLNLDTMLPSSVETCSPVQPAEAARQMFMQELYSSFNRGCESISGTQHGAPILAAVPAPAPQALHMCIPGAIPAVTAPAIPAVSVPASLSQPFVPPQGALVAACTEDDLASSMKFNMNMHEWPPANEDVEDFSGNSRLHKNDAHWRAQVSRNAPQLTILSSTPSPVKRRPEENRQVVAQPFQAQQDQVAVDPHAEHTTVMIRNLPLDLTQTRLLEELDLSGFQGCYDFCYMPCCFSTACGKGFAFLNCISPAYARQFITAWHGSHRFGSDGPGLNISYGVIQGLEANLAKWNTARMLRVRNPNLRPFVAASRQV